MTLAPNVNARFYLNKAILGCWKVEPAIQEKVGERLAVSSAKQAARLEVFLGFRLPVPHPMILK
jgi:hypothetical protein